MTSEKPMRDEEVGASHSDKGRKFYEMGTSSNSRSFEVESWVLVPTKNYSLQLMQKVIPPIEGNVIPATVHETLSFFRIYTSTVFKSQQMALVVLDFNRFLWSCVFNLVIKSLPLNYITFFLSSYVPHEHMFINKMAPLMYGYNVLMILSILTEFALTLDPLVIILKYALGIFHAAPWTRCSEAVFENKAVNNTVNCIAIDKFCDLMVKSPGAGFTNMGSPFAKVPFTNRSFGFFTAPPLYFYYVINQKVHYDKSESYQVGQAFVISVILAAIALCRKQIYKRRIWQVIHYSNLILILFYLGAICHILIYSLESEMSGKTPKITTVSGRSIQFLDYDAFADALGSPPLLHFLASRSNHQVNPAEDSAILVFSNSFHYILKGLALYLLRRYSEHHYGIMFLKVAHANLSFIYWPLYLSLIPFGNILACVFFLFQGITEFLSLVIAYNVSLECIQSAFPKLKWWLMLIITFSYVMIFKIKIIPSGYFPISVTYVFAKGCVALAEVFIIIYLYPIARLEDDITFHTGNPPPKVISFAMRFAPIYCFVKLYLVLSAQYDMILAKGIKPVTNYFRQCFFSVTGILIIFILHPVIKNLCIKRQNWRSLFRPVPEWGQKDHVQRQLRKQYDSREYVASTASRYLSRYLKSKLTSRMYRLEVCYDTDKGRRRSTIAPQFDSFRYDDETKKDV